MTALLYFTLAFLCLSTVWAQPPSEAQAPRPSDDDDNVRCPELENTICNQCTRWVRGFDITGVTNRVLITNTSTACDCFLLW